MANTYSPDLNNLRQDNLKSIFESIERAMDVLDIDFYLIGAFARDTWLSQKGIRTRGTKDIDFAVLVSNETTYGKLREYLVEKEGFIASTSNEYTFFDDKGYQLDILPFGAVEIEGKKFVDSQGMASTAITGFSEVYNAATEEVNFQGHVFKVSTIAGIVILKLLAWDDRPEMRTKDISDIGIIINHYFDLESEMIYARHSDLFEKEGNIMAVATRVLGREMQSVIKHNAVLRERVLSILGKNTASAETSEIGRLLVNVLNTSPASIEIAVNLLNELKQGIKDNLE